MSFVQKEDILIVLDETQLNFATFVLSNTHHFKFGLFDVSNSIWSKKLQNKTRYDEWSTDTPSHHSMSKKGEYNGGIKRQ